MQQRDAVSAMEWESGCLRLLDQRRLPARVSYLDYHDAPAVAEAITSMVVRGAPAIGIVAAYAVVLSVVQHYSGPGSSWRSQVSEEMVLLRNSRPTAVNLMWALDRMEQALAQVVDGVSPVTELLSLAQDIHDSDRRNNYLMGELAVDAIRKLSGSEKQVFMTHCNAGALATGGYGTALGVIRSAWRAGILERVHMGETRPWLQGSRLTAWEMMQEGIPAVLNADGAAAHVMSQSGVSWVVVGADRIAANGDVANKIGTYGLAVMARYHGAKMMVVAPSSTIDMGLSGGDQIPIEERGADELLEVGRQLLGVKDCAVTNPVFDVTPAALVDLLVTEKGVLYQPDTDSMRRLMLPA